jgi:hypothetical protein
MNKTSVTNVDVSKQEKDTKNKADNTNRNQRAAVTVVFLKLVATTSSSKKTAVFLRISRLNRTHNHI